MKLGIDEKRIAIEAIATLANIKDTMWSFILKPAGVPPDVYLPLKSQRDEITKYKLSKRQMAPLIIEALEKQNKHNVVRNIIKIASLWDKFHLSKDEYVARATVQKARERLGVIELMESEEKERIKREKQEESERLRRESDIQFNKESRLLLQEFDYLAEQKDPHGRGFFLEDLLYRIFQLHGIAVSKSFRRNEGAEQIDGAFKIDGWYYLVECRWRKKLADIRQLDGLQGQINRSGKQAMGLFLSIEGWSNNVCSELKQNREKSIILMDGYDLRVVLSSDVDFREFLLAKIKALNIRSEPFLGAKQYLKESNNGGRS